MYPNYASYYIWLTSLKIPYARTRTHECTQAVTQYRYIEHLKL